MPAVTADTMTLPRVALPAGDDALRPRRVKSVHTAPTGFEGEGFPVRRAFAGVPTADLDPFIHMDQLGEIDYPPYEAKGTDWHPHRGFETVTYIIDGTLIHQDSHGGGGVIRDGGTQWMTAGSGILHIETPPEDLVVSGGVFHGVQLWVNLPSHAKMIAPAYQDLDGDRVTLLSSPDGGTLIRVIAGEIPSWDDAGRSVHRGPGSTHTPVAVVHVTLAPGAELRLPWDPAHNALAYVLDGVGSVGDERLAVQTGQLAVFADGDLVTMRASEQRSLDVLLLGGTPLREPVAAYGPFVMNTRAELVQAMDDFQSGRLGTVPADAIRPYRRP